MNSGESSHVYPGDCEDVHEGDCEDIHEEDCEDVREEEDCEDIHEEDCEDVREEEDCEDIHEEDCEDVHQEDCEDVHQEDCEGIETILWIPPVDDNLKPKVGMIFTSLEDGSKFYKVYSKEGGFGVRKSTKNFNKMTKELQVQMFVCHKEGLFVPKKRIEGEGKKRKRRISREGCAAKIRFRKEGDEKWVVVKFIEGHNHPLTSPQKTHFIPSHRKLTPVKKALFKQYRQVNISTSKVVQIFGIQSGGLDKIGCIERDVRNFERDTRHEDRAFDAQQLLDHFRSEQEMNTDFYYAYQVDTDNKLTHILWVDGLARKYYAHFSDVVVFDTTYETNQYSMIFAPFTGVNHHGQSTIFGCGFLKDEKADSFAWLFDKWLEAMLGKHPIAIITDQDPAMNVAIKRMLPNTYHRYCMWHIMKKMSEKLGALFHDNGFNNLFKNCIYNSETPEEFETRWFEIVETYHLNDNDWLNSLYGMREKWIPAFSKDVFLAGMRTTQRSESINSFFDGYVNKKNSLVEFYSHSQLAIRKQRHKQLELDNLSKHSKPQLRTSLVMEKQMAGIYTSTIFNIFQDELVASMECVTRRIENEGSISVFDVKRHVEGKIRNVRYDMLQHKAWCNCKKFENEWIPCRHILVVLRNNWEDTLPSHFIVDRWTKNATMTPIFDTNGYELGSGCHTSSAIPTNEIDIRWHKCRSMSYQSNEAEQIVRKHLLCMEEELGTLSIGDGTDATEITNVSIYDPESFIQPPNMSKTKGSGKRIKGGKEKAMEEALKSQRLCKGCGKRGVDHDKRNCPVLKGRSIIDEVHLFESQASITHL